MTITNPQIRARARSTLVGQYKVLILAALLSRLIILVAGEFFAVSGSSVGALILSLVTSLVFSLFSVLLDTGATYMFLSAARLRPIRISDLFFAFKNQPDKPILVGLMLLLLNTALAVPFVIVGILLLRGSLPANVVYTSVLPFLLNLPAGKLPVALALIVVWAVPAVILNLTYAMALYLYVDNPNKTAIGLMRESREIMNGKKLSLFKLHISFVGYFLLGLLTMGIGFLWITPYVNMSETIFYLENKTAVA